MKSATAVPARDVMLRRLLQGIQQDLEAYGRLQELLELQFAAAMQPRSRLLAETTEAILVLVQGIDTRRGERMEFASRLAHRRDARAMEHVLERLPAASRERWAGLWAALQHKVRDCKALNARNGQLLMDQQEIMQRVRGAEVHTYAPA
jgi:flagella synthesis protein FlgN